MQSAIETLREIPGKFASMLEKQMREELYFKALGNNCLMEVKGKIFAAPHYRSA
jgi:hypothetical protein